MTNEEILARIQKTLRMLKVHKKDFEQLIVTNLYGEIYMVPCDLDTMDPRLEFRVHRKGEHRTQAFNNLTIALVHLYGHTAHIQREEQR